MVQSKVFQGYNPG